ncbi:ATP-binding protein [Flavobacterium tistrianum]|uniref:ATP-binding protein n=1 Tax=Flavobacterium tistrianum TaxID=1685414 RepID=UPI0021CFC692|nr:ATP-binding protein [Flavobacterium tistrianum]
MHLDYKVADSISSTNKKKNENSKDVIAFANSNGGVIIYGVNKYDEAGMTIIAVPCQRKIENNSED